MAGHDRPRSIISSQALRRAVASKNRLQNNNNNNTKGAFTRSGINHLLPVINVVGNTALAR